MAGHLCVLVTLLLSPLAAARPAGPAVNEQAVKEVKAGKRKVAKASWWGFDPDNATQALQAAINSGAEKVVVENMGTPWVVRGILLASDQELTFEEGVVVLAKRGSFKGRGDCLMEAKGRKNVTLQGRGATLRMWRADYAAAPYEKAEWRHCLSIRGCTNVRVSGLTLAESGGDGIYLGAGTRGETNRKVCIKDVTCDRNYRQGISVITAEDLLIEGCTLRDTAGTAPQAGIDFEPNGTRERLVNCVMRNCVIEGNAGDGLEFYLKHLSGSSEPVSIRIESCRSVNNRRCAVRWVARNASADGSTRGTVEFSNCELAGSHEAGILIAGNAVNGCRLRFTRCRIRDVALRNPPMAPIMFSSTAENAEDIGRVAFDDCVVIDPLQRPVMKYHDWGGGLRVTNVTGTILLNHTGRETKYKLTEKLLRQWMPAGPAVDVKAFDLKGVEFAPLADAAAGAGAADLKGVHLRGYGGYMLWARAGEQVSVGLRAAGVGGRKARAVVLNVLSPAGKPLRVKRKVTGAEAACTFAATQTGAYRLTCETKSDTVEVTSSSHRICIFGGAGPIHFFRTIGELLLYVPAGLKRFAVKINGSGLGERVKASLHDPSGRTVQQKDSIAQAHAFVVERADAAKAEVWSLRLAKPSEGILEDYYVRLLGVPPLLARTRQSLLRPVSEARQKQ